MPKNLDEMINLSIALASEFLFVRVDLFTIDNEITFSELTFVPGGYLMEIEPEEYYKVSGDCLDISNIIKKH